MRLTVVFSLILAGTSFAQTDASPTKKSVPVQKLDFTGASIRGDIEKPVLDLQVIPERPIFKKLIQIRGSFANELHNSVDAIR